MEILTSSNNNNNILLTANGYTPGGSGQFTYARTMKFDYSRMYAVSQHADSWSESYCIYLSVIFM
jgi:hypothetical protein